MPRDSHRVASCPAASLHKDAPIPRTIQTVGRTLAMLFWADCTTNISERRFSTGTGGLMLLIIQLKFFGCNIP
jgi:hypothetical protein